METWGEARKEGVGWKRGRGDGEWSDPPTPLAINSEIL